MGPTNAADAAARLHLNVFGSGWERRVRVDGGVRIHFDVSVFPKGNPNETTHLGGPYFDTNFGSVQKSLFTSWITGSPCEAGDFRMYIPFKQPHASKRLAGWT